MQSNKSVKEAFDKASSTYDQTADIQKLVATELLAFMQNFYDFPVGDKLLDIGCGTGFVARNILENTSVNYSDILQTDISPKMLDVASQYSPTLLIDWNAPDVYRLKAAAVSGYSLITSSMSLQWLDDLQSLMANIREVAANGAFVAFAVPIYGSFSNINTANKLPHISEIFDGVINSGLHLLSFETKQYTQEFFNHFSLLRNLYNTGVYSRKERVNGNIRNSTREENAYIKCLNWRIAYICAKVIE